VDLEVFFNLGHFKKMLFVTFYITLGSDMICEA